MSANTRSNTRSNNKRAKHNPELDFDNFELSFVNTFDKEIHQVTPTLLACFEKPEFELHSFDVYRDVQRKNSCFDKKALESLDKPSNFHASNAFDIVDIVDANSEKKNRTRNNRNNMFAHICDAEQEIVNMDLSNLDKDDTINLDKTLSVGMRLELHLNLAMKPLSPL